MALSPLKPASARAVKVTRVTRPSKTYSFDFNTGELGLSTVDGIDALRQFIAKAIYTARFRFLIYTSQYGCEIDDLIGQDVSTALLQAEIPRVLKEALIYDDRILDVRNFVIRRGTGTEADALYVSFTVDSVTNGTFTQEVVI
ncbi:DUF2634 domain-containing protein [Paenibacillus agricola]|uniref:DUF2634 domain-containing protein n=1 Tax=Paenibacillus agricola TaxID=2716264 RepID=A0ABX0J8G2_9BACL|nr:DUF2634 domain-containing protein [Paenibacillus agricola]NHN31123.1 DUF2634 domain-containing protein [Paenibacillus agricola]